MIQDKSAFFTIIGIIVTFFGILTPIVYGELKEKSELEIRQLSSVTIINKPSEIDGLEIFYQKLPITDLNKLTLKITNKSKLAVTKSDFISPLKIEFSKGVRLISYKIEDNNPKNILSEVNIDSTRQSINIGFELLNPDDYIVIGILYTGFNSTIETQARIKGIKKIIFIVESNDLIDFIAPFIVLFFVFFSTVILFIIKREKNNSILSYSKFIEDKEKYLKYSMDDFKKEIRSIFSHFPSSFVNREVLKVEQIFKNKKIENKANESINIIDNDLLSNINLNKKGNIVAQIIRVIGIIYLLFWIISYCNKFLI